MPITEAEWRDAAVHPEDPDVEPAAVGASETETDLVLAFLSENHDAAFTRAEIVRGVDFGESTPPETIKETLLSLPNQLVDVAGTLTASGIVVDDVSEALDELVAEGVVERRRIERGDGEPVVYYRLAE